MIYNDKNIVTITIEVKLDAWKESKQKEQLLELLKEFDVIKLTWEEK